MVERNSVIPVKHPGVVFKERCLEKHGISVSEAARKLHVSRKHMSEFVNGKTSVTVLFARKLEIGTGVEADYWLNRQLGYDLFISKNKQIKAEALYAYG